MDRNATRRTHHPLAAAALGLVLLGIAPLAAHASGRTGRGPSPERAVERLTEKLDLTPEQRPLVQGIMDESFEKRREAREAHRSEMDTLREETHARLASVLTAEQMDELRQLRRERRGCRERRRGCDCGPVRRNGSSDSSD